MTVYWIKRWWYGKVLGRCLGCGQRVCPDFPTPEEKPYLERWRRAARELCLVRDGNVGVCNRERGHESYHCETLPDGTLWSSWRSILPSDEENRAASYILPSQRKLVRER